MTINSTANRLGGAVLAAGLTALACVPAGTATAADITSQELADGVYLFQGAGSNVVVLADGRGLLVVDGGLDENSRDLVSAIQRTTGGQRIDVLIDTHWHPEQVGLNDEAARDGARIIASDQTKMFLSNEMTSPLYDAPVAPLDDSALPTEVSRYGGELNYGGQPVEYHYLPAAHTNGDFYVYFPEANVLAAGGAVGSDSWPLIDYWNGGIVGGLIQAHETLAQIVEDDTIVVPASGPAITGADLKRHRDMYRQFFRDIAHMMNNGMGYDDAVTLNPLRGHEDEFGDPSEFLDGAYRSKEMAEVPD